MFLDTKSHLKDGCIETDLYTKPTDKHQYLLPSSCHPSHIKRNIPKGLAYRTKRICSNPDTAEKRLHELRGHLQNRNYNSRTIDVAFEATGQITRNDLLQYKEKTPNNRIPFVTTYHPDGPNIKSIIDKHWTIIESSERLQHIFREKPLLAYRRPKNLKDHLVRAKVKTSRGEIPGCYKCSGRLCNLCNMLKEGETFASRKSGISFNIHRRFDCRSTNVIYLLTCKECGIQYIGETNNFRLRMNNRKSHIGHKENNPVARHYNLANHSIQSLEIMIIDGNPSWSRNERQERERFWMRQLQTLTPDGLNEKHR